MTERKPWHPRPPRPSGPPTAEEIEAFMLTLKPPKPEAEPVKPSEPKPERETTAEAFGPEALPGDADAYFGPADNERYP